MFCTRDSAEKRICFIHKSDSQGMSGKSKATVALTGATGFLGSHLMASMLSEGYSIIVLGRSTKEETLSERISRLLRWFGIENLFSQVICVEADLS